MKLYENFSDKLQSHRSNAVELYGFGIEIAHVPIRICIRHSVAGLSAGSGPGG